MKPRALNIGFGLAVNRSIMTFNRPVRPTFNVSATRRSQEFASANSLKITLSS